MTANAAAKKGKGKKALDSSEASKLVAARISQLEVDTAAEKEQEAEIGTSIPPFFCRRISMVRRFYKPPHMHLSFDIDVLKEGKTLDFRYMSAYSSTNRRSRAYAITIEP